MSARFEFTVEARGGQAEAAFRRLLELLRGTSEAALRELDAEREPDGPGWPRRITPPDEECEP